MSSYAADLEAKAEKHRRSLAAAVVIGTVENPARYEFEVLYNREDTNTWCRHSNPSWGTRVAGKAASEAEARALVADLVASIDRAHPLFKKVRPGP